MILKIHTVKQNDIANSITGFTLSIWFQSCPHRCDGCYNKETWSEDGGEIYSIEDIKNMILSSRHKNVSLLGGEPFAPLNRTEVINLIRWIKHETDKTLYVWSGYLYKEIQEFLPYDISIIDYLIDGKFEKNKMDFLLLRGSTNQKIFKNGVFDIALNEIPSYVLESSK